MLDKREWVKRHADHLRRAPDARAARPCRHVRRHPHRAGDARVARRRALHAQRGLQHHVRPRRHRGDDDCARARPARCRAATARRLCTTPPAGTIRAHARWAGGAWWAGEGRDRVESVSFVNVPSFVLHGGLNVKLGVAAASRRRRLRRRLLRHRRQRGGRPADRCRASARVAARRHGDQDTRSSPRHTIAHPLEPGLRGIYGTIFTGPPSDERADLRERHDLRRRRSGSIAVRHRHVPP